MKILYGITKSNFGGAQRYVFDLAKEAKARGHEVAVICGGKGLLVRNLEKEDIRVIALDNLQRDIALGKEFSSFWKILKILREEKPDIFHINSSKMGGLGALAGRFARTYKIIFTAHGWAFNEPRPGYQKFIIKFFAWLTVILSHTTICVSESTRAQVSNWPFVESKILVIPNGIREFHLLPRETTVFTVGVISELHQIKGLDILLKAWNKFSKKHKVNLSIIGEGEERKKLEKLVKELGIGDSVVFKGFLDNARARLKDFDIFVLPSRSEAMPYSLLEAGIVGLPTIATSVGGIAEVIENGINGILVPPEDVESLFSSLLLFYENPRMRDRLGIALKETIMEKFSLEQMFEKTFKIYLQPWNFRMTSHTREHSQS
jgi:glycosyltransferase involved in cell wall biosynthesis